jgi:hypothetical protein
VLLACPTGKCSQPVGMLPCTAYCAPHCSLQSSIRGPQQPPGQHQGPQQPPGQPPGQHQGPPAASRALLQGSIKGPQQPQSPELSRVCQQPPHAHCSTRCICCSVCTLSARLPVLNVLACYYHYHLPFKQEATLTCVPGCNRSRVLGASKPGRQTD